MWEVIGGLLLVVGAFFVLVAAFGLLRLPDVLARMQATSKATTLGLSTIMVAAAMHAGTVDTTIRVMLIILFTFMTAPIGAHVLSRAAYRTAKGGWGNLVVDELGAAGDQAATIHRLAEAFPGADASAASVLVCLGAGENERTLLAAAGLDRVFQRVAVDATVPRHGAAPHEVTAWVQVTLDRVLSEGHGLLLFGEAAVRPELSAVARRMVQRSTIPVWLAGSGAASGGPVLLALPFPRDKGRIRAARAALQDAAAVAKASNRPLHVVHVSTPVGSGRLGQHARSGAAQADIDRELTGVQETLRALAARTTLATPAAAIHVERGDPRDVIPAVAASTGAALVVIGTRGRRWSLTAALMPPLAEVVAARLQCSTLVVGPGADLEWMAER
jgi:multicomponent Na+:H+ antiporter subunit G